MASVTMNGYVVVAGGSRTRLWYCLLKIHHHDLSYLRSVQGLQNTSNETFRDVVGNGVRLEVPRFQRDYSWESYHWSDLWEDIETVVAENGWHYLGFVVLQQRGDNRFAIIDGQQRITTLSLLVLAAMQAILEVGGPDAAERAKVVRLSYIGRQDPVTLLTSNKLSLNRNNDRFYSTYLSELRPAPATGLKVSERALKQGFDYFLSRLTRLGSGAAIAERVELIASRLYFTVIEVTTDLNAYKVFETLNARGVKLSAADLLKNYLFATVDQGGQHEAELTALEDRWSEIIEGLGRDAFQDFLRAYWNSRYGQVRAPQLYRRVRERVTKPAEVFGLLRDLTAAAPIYAALEDPGHELWAEQPLVVASLETLRLLRVRQQLPLLLAGYESLDSAGFAKLLRDVVAFTFRYNTVGSSSSGEQETLYGEVALQIRAAGKYASSWLTRLYPSDQVFRAQFRTWAVSSTPQGRNLASYALIELERQQNSQQVLTGSAKLTLEHILPQTPTVDWYAADDPVWTRAVWRLGNLALLERTLNQEAGQRPINDKLALYTRSAFRLTQEVAQYTDNQARWTEKSIDQRQLAMSKLATVVWRLSGG